MRDTTGIVFDIEEFAVYDGPGIRMAVFLKGCPLRCEWCHNPEGQRFEREWMFYKDRCIGCGRCREGELTEDDLKQAEKKAQDITDKSTKAVDKCSEAKQKEVITL